MEVVIDQKGEETVIKIKGRLDTNTALLHVYPGSGIHAQSTPLGQKSDK